MFHNAYAIQLLIRKNKYDFYQEMIFRAWLLAFNVFAFNKNIWGFTWLCR